MRKSRIYAFALVIAGASLLVCVPSRWTAPPAEAQYSRQGSPGIDALLGRGGRAIHADTLKKATVNGQTYSWEQYSRWGKELFHEGQVKEPPTGMPSEPLSYFYRCTDCHNNQREDAVLTQQDPETRAWMADSWQQDPNAHPLYLAPGTTLWGAVNRESFYNDSYSVYHFLLAPDGEEMDPKSLEDATQVCCKYCSVGRFAETWEIHSLLTYFWDLEIRLVDLLLPQVVENSVLEALSNPVDPPQVAAMREFLLRQYLRKARDCYTAVPEEIVKDKVGAYPDGLAYEGDPSIGKRLYELACHHCHGEDKCNEVSGGDLVRELKRFHKILSKGTAHDDEPYMPMFTSQRLSRQQIIDIQAYLLAERK